MRKTQTLDATSLEPLRDKSIAIVGYGSQGHAHALNLRDQGLDVVVGVRKDSRSEARAKQDGVRTATVVEAAASADVVSMLVPDPEQPDVFSEVIEPNLSTQSTLVFAHGFNVHFGQIHPPDDVDVVMIAPKAPGPLVRKTFVEGCGVPALIAVHQDASGSAWDRARAYAAAIGCARARVVETTFAEETETDLFGEQAVLCGGVSQLIQLGFETLVEAGYQPEVAYFECLHELKLIVDLLHEGGFRHMRACVSDTAEFGELTRGQAVVGREVKGAMERVLQDIVEGRFALDWVLESRSGFPRLKAARDRQGQLLIESVGDELRDMMPWLAPQEVNR